MGYPTMCCEVEEKKIACGEQEVPLAIIVDETNKELGETVEVLRSIIIRLVNAPSQEKEKGNLDSFTDAVNSVNHKAYECRCLARRIEQLLYGESRIE